MMKILFVTSEAYPLIKTGGLADVSGSLPQALKYLGHDVRLLMPAYGDVLSIARHFQPLKCLQKASDVAIFEGILPESEVPVWLLAHSEYFHRTGNPYLDADGKPWSDNAERFSLLCRVAVEVAMDRLGLSWKPDIVHSNDWPTGLIPAMLEDEPRRPATVFTIHNLAYQGIFPYDTFLKIGLPKRFWTPDALEFYGQLSFIKGGLVFSDRINTVSPSYAREIQGDEYGCGLQGLLSHRQERLSGILNGIDTTAWNPVTDPWVPVHFDVHSLEKRGGNKRALQMHFHLVPDESIPLLAWVGRLVQQKGIDLVIDLLPRLIDLRLQIVVVGSGETRYEQVLSRWATLYPDRIAVRLAYDEAAAHLIEAGTDLFLMPSRFEPCGLNQMYSQRYGALPIVRQVGGLADTVEDANPDALDDGRATGFVFQPPTSDALYHTVQRALSAYNDKSLWQSLQKAAMSKDFSWEVSAQHYLTLYTLASVDREQGGHSWSSHSVY